MVRRSTVSEFYPAPPFYRNQGQVSQTPGGPNNIVSINAPMPPNMQCSSATRGIDGTGNRINSAGQQIAINAELPAKSLDNPINPSGN